MAGFSPEDIQFKTMNTMDRAAKLAMISDYDTFPFVQPQSVGGGLGAQAMIDASALFHLEPLIDLGVRLLYGQGVAWPIRVTELHRSDQPLARVGHYDCAAAASERPVNSVHADDDAVCRSITVSFVQV